MELRSILAQTQVPSYITTIRGSGFNAAGERIYGPQDKLKAATIQWTLVPIESKTFLFEFLDSQNRVLGNATVAVNLKESEVTVIDDLSVNFDPGPTPEPTPQPEKDLLLPSNQNYQFNTDTGVVSPPIGGSSNPPGWNSQNKEFELETFTLETGSVLNVSGNTPLRIKTEGDATVNGTLSFTGADGTDGGDTEFGATPPVAPRMQLMQTADPLDLTGAAGNNGADGGVSLTSLGQISGSGTIISQGGKGGKGGDVDISTDHTAITSALTGGRGGNGGAPGQVTLLGAPGSVLVSIVIHTQGGNGGDGGNVNFSGDFTFTDSGGTATGGRGGDATGAGSSGGDGGDVLFSGQNSSNFNLAFGGAGGNGAVFGGNGGSIVFSAENSQNGGTATAGAGGIGEFQGGAGGRIDFSGHRAYNVSGATATGGAGGAGLHNVAGVGGQGGDVAFAGRASANYGGTATAGRGGNGGSHGGDGGKIEVSGPEGGFNNDNSPLTGGAGGDGGSQGGRGGNVEISVLNRGPVTGGAGGNATGGNGNGGNGGNVRYGPTANVISPPATSLGGAGGSPNGSPGNVTGP